MTQSILLFIILIASVTVLARYYYSHGIKDLYSDPNKQGCGDCQIAKMISEKPKN